MVHETMRVAIDARYIREKPSGIAAYVRAIVDRMPREAPADRFRLWTHPRAPRPLSHAPNTEEIVVGPSPNSPLTLFWARGAKAFMNPANTRATTSAVIQRSLRGIQTEKATYPLIKLCRCGRSRPLPRAVGWAPALLSSSRMRRAIEFPDSTGYPIK